MRWIDDNGRKLIGIAAVLILLAASLLVILNFQTSQNGKTVLRWGSWETFDDIAVGTNGGSSFRDVSLEKGESTDSVILDNWLYVSSIRGTRTDVAVYAPSSGIDDGYGWNISFESMPLLNSSGWSEWGRNGGSTGLVTYLLSGDGTELTGVRLTTGNRANESISVLGRDSGTWENVSEDISGPLMRYNDGAINHSSRYIVSFDYSYGTNEIRIAIWHTDLGWIHSGNVTVPSASSMDNPRLKFVLDSDLAIEEGLIETGGWIIDNLAFRSLFTRYIIVEPEFEIISMGDRIWVTVSSIGGEPVPDADVLIDGNQATFDGQSSRYQADISNSVRWDVEHVATILVDGSYFNSTFSVTTTPILDQSRELLSRWWNGWSWASVAGRDDCLSPSEGISTWVDFDHPVTTYLTDSIGGGSSGNLLPTQSEIALHYPHDFAEWSYANWTASTNKAEQGQNFLKEKYGFASKWDDPSYVGVGDMFISMANPGNGASLQMLFAQYASGIRIEGSSSDWRTGYRYGLIGGWGIESQGDNSQFSSWYPRSRADLMNTPRQWNLAANISETQIRQIAENNGFLRMYGHRGDFANWSLVAWVVNNKSGYAFENWKATDGEVASYINGLMTTDVSFNSSSSSTGKWAYDISREDPIAQHYWRVPITVAINVSDKVILDVTIKEGTKVLRISDGSLKNLSRAREMDVGFDLRTSSDNSPFERTMFISYFWNESSTLEILFNSSAESMMSVLTIGVIEAQHGFPVMRYLFGQDSISNTLDIDGWQIGFLPVASSRPNDAVLY